MKRKFDIEDRVFWFDGDGLGYIEVYTGIIVSIKKDTYGIFSNKKPNFVEKKEKDLFVKDEVPQKKQERKQQWAKLYIETAIKQAEEKSKYKVVTGYHTIKYL